MIGTVGSEEKAAFVRQHACDHAVLYRETDFVAAVKAIVPEGVAAVFDGVGKDTFHASLECVRRFAMLVNYGNASGHPPPLDLLMLAKKGSLSVARPALSSITADVALMRQAAAELFDLVARGVLTFPVSRCYPLADAAQAHRDIEARKSAGSMMLIRAVAFNASERVEVLRRHRRSLHRQLGRADAVRSRNAGIAPLLLTVQAQSPATATATTAAIPMDWRIGASSTRPPDLCA